MRNLNIQNRADVISIPLPGTDSMSEEDGSSFIQGDTPLANECRLASDSRTSLLLSEQPEKEEEGPSIRCNDLSSDCQTERSFPSARICDSRVDSIYQRAMVLLHERCTSSISKSGRKSTPSGVMSFGGPSPGPRTPTYFHIKQTKPVPMEPLKAWRGYHGNVYFEPIQIGQAVCWEPVLSPSPDVDRCSKELREILVKSRRSPSRALTEPRGIPSNGNTPSGGDPRPPSRSSRARSSVSLKYQGPRQMSILDKEKVFLQKHDSNLEEDLTWLMGQESTGSLCVDSPLGNGDHTGRHVVCSQPRTSSSKKKRTDSGVCKGSVSHHFQKAPNPHTAMMSVCGDKYQPLQLPSPILRSQTQYSQSSTRLAMLSPDPYAGYTNYDRRPPLEQLRATMRGMDISEEMRLQNTQQKKNAAQEINRKAPYVRLDAEMRKFVNQPVNEQNMQRQARK